MVASVSLLAISFLLATSESSRRNGKQKRSAAKGRQRYKPSNQQQQGKRRPENKNTGGSNERDTTTVALPPPPPPTDPDGPFPTFLTCRHTYEANLIEEIERMVERTSGSTSCQRTITATIITPGLVRVDHLGISGEEQQENSLLDPVYALQELSQCRIVNVPNSIKGLAKKIADIDAFRTKLTATDTSNNNNGLVVHALVPGMAWGQVKPVLQRRSQLVSQEVYNTLKPICNSNNKSNDTDSRGEQERSNNNNNEPWLLQILLLSADTAAVSLTQCRTVPSFPACTWPNPNYPMGLAKVDITNTKMPSSAYRKLLEALAYMFQNTTTNNHAAARFPIIKNVVDLGASPGGWTAALVLMYQCRVIAIDRSPLDARMMNNLLVSFQKGDAFTYKPPLRSTSTSSDDNDNNNDAHDCCMMVSDIIAYPERIVKLLDTWCGERLAKYMIVTMKFQGTTPAWDDLELAMNIVKSHGYYHVRAKHFFNNKNEVTLMVMQKEGASIDDDDDSNVKQPPNNNPMTEPMYNVIIT